jgi:hypothetical protein
MIFLPRSWWREPSGEPQVAAGKRAALVFHHTAIPGRREWDSLLAISEHMERLAAIRPELFKGRPSDCPYNAVAFLPPRHRSIHSGLVLVEGIGMDRRGAHTGGANTPSVGVAFAGDFSEYDAPVRLSCAVAEIAGWMDSFFGRRLPISGHRDHKATACPGDALYAALAAYKEKEG